LLGEHDPATLTSLFNLANIMGFLADAGETASLFAKGLEATRGRAESNRLAVQFMFGLGVAYRAMGRYDDAKPLLDEALQTQQRLLTDGNLWTLITRYQRIGLLRRMKRYDEAESEAKETYRLAKENLSEQNSFTLMSEAELVRVYLAQGKRSDAEPHLQRLREAAQPTMPPLPPLIQCMGEVGRDLLEQKDYTRAEPFLRWSADLTEKRLPEGWWRSSSARAWGGCLLGQKKYAEAEPYLLKGCEGLQKYEEKTLKPFTPERRREEAAKVTENVKWLVQLYEETHKPEEAAKWRKLLGERTRKE
jgi:tetratricopeptide (TPR) repeat protein